jgi:DNA polymerase I-like protein with 3'-5' exonuclease and polymerase domains
MHRELYNGMYGRYPTDAERKPFKRFSFLLVYGGGVTTLMAQSGCDRATAKKFINTFYARYKGVKEYHESIVKKANDECIISYDESKLVGRNIPTITLVQQVDTTCLRNTLVTTKQENLHSVLQNLRTGLFRALQQVT